MMDRRSFLALLAAPALPAASRQTAVSVDADRFMMNGKPTYEGRLYKGMRIEGLLMNSRMVQGIFDDLNPETRSRWAYPDTKRWDPDRNTREFGAAMPQWRSFGLLAFTINLQGGSIGDDDRLPQVEADFSRSHCNWPARQGAGYWN